MTTSATTLATPAAATAAPVPTVVATTATAITATVTAIPDTPPSQQAAAPDSPASAPKPVKYSGYGDKILRIAKIDQAVPGFAKITHQGSRNFVVETVENGELLVNEIGNYSGVVVFDADGAGTRRMKITADGSWTVTLLPLESLRRFQSSIGGKGDDIVVYLGDEATVAVKHSGQSNFVVETYGASSDLLINEIGNYSGEQLLRGTCLVKITADGPWSIKATD